MGPSTRFARNISIIALNVSVDAYGLVKSHAGTLPQKKGQKEGTGSYR